jgi:hypothetical protein
MIAPMKKTDPASVAALFKQIQREERNNWKRLYSFARKTKAINPGLIEGVLKGWVRPNPMLNTFVKRNINA